MLLTHEVASEIVRCQGLDRVCAEFMGGVNATRGVTLLRMCAAFRRNLRLDYERWRESERLAGRVRPSWSEIEDRARAMIRATDADLPPSVRRKRDVPADAPKPQTFQ